MKYLLFILPVLTYSCTNSSNHSRQQLAAYPNWNIRDSTVQIHTYTKSNLLDSTLETWYHFRNGVADDHLNTLITRYYDATNKLEQVRSFDFSDHSHKWVLISKNIKQYDSRGNLVLDVLIDTKKAKSTISRMYKMTYNRDGQEIYRFAIFKKLEPFSKNWTVDSAIAHNDDVTVPTYDTIISSYSYDKNGRVATETSMPGRPDEVVHYLTYSGGVKLASYAVSADGDTISVQHYQQEGDLTRKTKQFLKTTFNAYTDTSWYMGNKPVKTVYYNNNDHTKKLQVYEYDARGNEIREVTYE